MKKQSESIYLPDMPETEGLKLNLTAAQRVRFPNLRPSTESISRHLPKLEKLVHREKGVTSTEPVSSTICS